MLETQDLSTAVRPNSPRARGALPPVLTFFALVAIVGVVTLLASMDPGRNIGGSALGRAESASARPKVAPVAEDDALREFRALEDLWVRAYRQRDETLVKLFAAPDAPTSFGAIGAEIRQLRNDGVLYRTRLSQQELELVSGDATGITLEEHVTRTSRFIDERTGRDITQRREPQRLTIEWTIRRYPEGWRIFKSVITAARTAR
ncbi:MAG: hypothetical protein ABR529_03710 [Actinomycetota bacterium]